MSNTYGEIISKVKFFDELEDPDFIWKLLPMLKPIIHAKDDVLYNKGDFAEDCNIIYFKLLGYFILSGKVKLYSEKGFPFITYTVGDMFGDSDTLTEVSQFN